MDLHQLEIFVAVVETSSVSQAAERVHLSPGAVSLQLQNLAASLGTEFFVRSGRKLLPTPAAHRLADDVRPILRQMKLVRQAFENKPGTDTRPFNFATGVTTLIYRLGPPLRRLRQQYPQTPLQVTVSVTEDIIKGLLNRRFDLGLISLPVPVEGLRVIPLYEEELLFLRPAATRVTQHHVGTVHVEELAKVPFLLYPKHSNMRTIIDGFLNDIGIVPRVVMEAEDTEAIKSLVQSGFGYSMLPEHALQQPGFFQALRLPNRHLVRRQALAMPETPYPRKLTKSIAEFLVHALAEKKQARRAGKGKKLTARA